MSRLSWSASLFAVAALGFAAGRWAAPPAPSAVPEPVSAPRVRERQAPSPKPVARPVAPVAPPRPEVVTRPVEGAAAPAAEVRAPTASRLLTTAAVREALQDPDPVRRQLALADILRGLTAQNARQIAEGFLGRRSDGEGRNELALVMDAWGQVDGPAAVAYAQNLQDERSMTSALTGWAARYPEAARQWAMAKEENPDNPWMIPVIAGVARGNLGRAVELLYALPYGAARGRSLDFVVDAYARQGLPALVSWAEGIPDERLRQGTAVRVAGRMAQEDAPRAAAWGLAHADAERQMQAVLPAVTLWARDQPRDAVEWAEKLEPGRTRDLALEHAVGTWAWKAPADAEAWLSRTAPGPSYDRARMSIGMRYFESDPVRAMSWVSTLSDEAMRNRMLERIAGAWRERDPAAADKFLAN